MISIIRPLTIAAVAVNIGETSKGNLLTPSPREVWVTPSTTSLVIDIDLGSIQSFDTIYLGGHNLPADAHWICGPSSALGADVSWESSGMARLPGAEGPRYQLIMARATTAPSRYLRLYLTFDTAQACEFGALVVGQSLRHPYAYSSGRQLIDTTRRSDLFDGGFGVEEGVIKSSFKWRFVDLDATKRDALWSLVSNRGINKPVVVIEDVSAAPPPEASVHYGLFDKFEAWERANATDTVWALSMTEWR